MFNRTVDEFKYCLKSAERRIGISTLEENGFKVILNVWIKSQGFTDTKLSFHNKRMSNWKSGGINLPGMAD